MSMGRVDIAVIRHGDPVAEVFENSLRFDTVFGYESQIEYAIGERKALIIGKRDKRKSAKKGNILLETIPVNISFAPRRWANKIYYEYILTLYWLLRTNPRVVVSIGHSYDHIVAHIYSHIAEAKHVIALTGNIFWGKSPVKKFFQGMIKHIVRDTGKVTVLSNGKAPIVELENAGLKTDHIIEYGPYYPPEYFVDVELEPIFYDGDTFKILFVGRLDGTKGEFDFVRAAKMIVEQVDERELGKKLKFIVIGDGPKRTGLERFIGELGLGNYFIVLGMKPSFSIYSYMRHADIVAVPSYLEGLGKVLIEAKMAGAATVAYKTGGLRYLIEDGVDGLLVDKGDVSGLAKRMIELIENDELRQKISRNALKTREKYTDFKNSFAYKLREVLDEILGKEGSGLK